MTWFPANYTDTCSANPALNPCQPDILAFLAFLTQYLGHSYDKLNYDKKDSIDRKDDEYDFIIVGAGSAGCVVANRLSEVENWKVLLLEAGDEEPIITDIPGMSALTQNSNIDYGYYTLPEPAGISNVDKKPILYTRGKIMGGCSTLNDMWYVRGNKQDYDDWADQGNKGWSWNDVLPYFKKSEDARNPDVLLKSPTLHGTGGYLTVGPFPTEDPNAPVILKAWKELGLTDIDYNNGSQVGVARAEFTSIHGARQSTNGAFIRPIRWKRANLIIKTNARATKIIINKQTKQAIGVEYTIFNKNGNIPRRAFARKEVIISAGVFESPKLLLLSGIGPANDLQNLHIEVMKNLPVGHNLQDHFNVNVAVLDTSKNVSSFPTAKQMRDDTILWLSTHEGPLSRLGVSNVLAFHQTSYETRPGVPDIEYFIAGFFPEKYGNTTDLIFTPAAYYDNVGVFAYLLTPKSHGFLKLNASDPTGSQPLIQMNYLNDPQDLKVIVEGLRFARNIVNTKALIEGGIVDTTPVVPGCKSLEFDSDEYLECLVKKTLSVGYNAVGTCKMGPNSDKRSVVDPYLRVHGISGLRVIDASIMPHIVRGNANAPTIMIAEKGSDMIKKTWL